MATMRSEHERYLEEIDEGTNQLKEKIEQLEREKVEVSGHLEEERRSVVLIFLMV